MDDNEHRAIRFVWGIMLFNAVSAVGIAIYVLWGAF